MSLPPLIVIAGKDKGKSGEIIRAIPAERRAMIAARGEKAKKGQAQARERMLQQAAANAWDASPISTARLTAEVWEQIKNEDWTLGTETHHMSFWPYRLWNLEKHYHAIGGSGAGGVGYNAPGALGAALPARGIFNGNLGSCCKSHRIARAYRSHAGLSGGRCGFAAPRRRGCVDCRSKLGPWSRPGPLRRVRVDRL